VLDAHDLYELFGVDADADTATIRTAYRQQSKESHLVGAVAPRWAIIEDGPAAGSCSR
jgi:DnaJ-domain-containing protein 1